jgi:hypothetical protein
MKFAWILLEIGLIVIEDVFRRDPSHDLLEVVEEGVDITVGDSRPAPLYEAHGPHRQLWVPFEEPSQEIWTGPIVNKPNAFFNCKTARYRTVRYLYFKGKNIFNSKENSRVG